MGIFDNFFGPNIDVEKMYNRNDINGLLNALDEGNTKTRSLAIGYMGKILEYYQNRSRNEFKDYLVNQFDKEDIVQIIMKYDLPLKVVNSINLFELLKQSIFLGLLEHLIFDYSIHDVRGKSLKVLLQSNMLKSNFKEIWDIIYDGKFVPDIDGNFSNLSILDFPFHVTTAPLPRPTMPSFDYQYTRTFRANCVIHGPKKPWAHKKMALADLRYNVGDY
jgi:hypothetical protein